MRLATTLAVLTVLACAATGGLAAETTAAADVAVACSIAPQSFLIERIGAEAVSVSVLVGPGQSPHTFEPTPRQMARLADARIYFAVGLPFERELLARASALNPDLRVADTAAGLLRRRVEDGHDHDACGHDAHSHDESGLSDPHVWLDPRNAGSMAVVIRDALAALVPERAPLFDANLQTLLSDLDALHVELAAVLEPLEGEDVYVYHPAFGYFTDAYGLTQVPVELGGMEPGARELASLIGRASADGVRVVFVQPQFSSRSAEAIAAEIGGAVVPIDPLSGNYLENLRAIAHEVRAALAAPGNGAAR